MVAWQEADALANGIRLHYYRSGGDKPPLILLHGITDSGQCWPLVSDALAPSFDVIALDARGHGKSEKPSAGYSRRDHAEDVAGLIERLELDRPGVMGHSMGAGSAAQLAAMHPELVGALVLEDPPWRAADPDSSPEERAAEWRENLLARKQLSAESLLEAGRLDNPTWSDEILAPWAAAKLAVSPDVLGFIMEDDMRWQEVVAGIRCPTLLITADVARGAIVAPEVASAAAQANSQIEVVRIADAGHSIRREQFDVYIAAVNEFLQRSLP